MKRTDKDRQARSLFLESFYDDKPILELDTSEMDREDWETLRGGFLAVGGSDIGVLMGFSEYNTAKDLFYQKLGIFKRQFVDNKYAFTGRIMEKFIANLWRHWTGDWESTMRNYEYDSVVTREYQDRGMLMDPDIPGVIANIDGDITLHPVYSSSGILEIKKMTKRSRDKYENRINPGHIFQVNAYMLVTGAKYAEIVIFEEALDLDVYTIEPSPIIQEAILATASQFYENLLKGAEILETEKNVDKIVQALSPLEPSSEDSPLLSEFYTAKRKALEVSDYTIGATKEFQDWVIERQMKDLKIKDLSDEKGTLDSKIKGWMDQHNATKVTLDDDDEVRFSNRLWFSPKIKKRLLQNTTA